MATSVTDDDIYFGSERCFFRHAPGFVEEFTGCSDYKFFSPVYPTERFQVSQKGAVDDTTCSVVVPTVPAMDITKKSCNHVTTMAGSDLNFTSFPDVLKRPLMKCPHDHPLRLHDVHGIKSGVRSGLIRCDKKWYRLKGCGNNEDGFCARVHTFPNTASCENKETWQEIRGCSFRNTSLRELYYTSLLSNCPVMQSRKIVSANRSIGTSHFTARSEALFGEEPCVQPVCIMEQTIGDRRLGTHVLAGIELILPLLLNVEALDVGKFLSAFPPVRPRERGKDECLAAESASTLLESIVSTEQFICDYCLGTSLDGMCGSSGGDDDQRCLGLHWPSIRRDATSLANMLLPAHGLPEQSPPVCSSEGKRRYPPQWTNEGPREMPARWREAWDETSRELAGHLERIAEREQMQEETRTNWGLSLDSNRGSSVVLAYLYACVGYDCGNFLRGLHEKRTCWGTFQDAMCRRELDEWHCNAHSNSFVLIPPPPCHVNLPGYSSPLSHRPMLGFLDLDMAYSAETCLSVGKDSESSSGADFDVIMWKEYVNLMEVLAGSDSSSGVPQIARGAIETQDSKIRGMQSALKDTLVLAYIDAYNGSQRACLGEEYNPDLHAAAHCVAKLGVMVMAPYVA